VTSIFLEIWGKKACFTRAEFKAERVSYPVITPSAARGMLEAIYWHPGLSYQIRRVYVQNPIQFTRYTINEVGRKASSRNALAAMRHDCGDRLQLNTALTRQTRSCMVLRDVRYVVEFTMSCDQWNRDINILRHRLKHGKCHSQPYLGHRELIAQFRPWPEHETIAPYPSGVVAFGLMPYETKERAPDGSFFTSYFDAVLVNGVLEVAGCEVLRNDIKTII